MGAFFEPDDDPHEYEAKDTIKGLYTRDTYYTYNETGGYGNHGGYIQIFLTNNVLIKKFAIFIQKILYISLLQMSYQV